MAKFEYTKENIRKLQLVELEILKEFVRVCDEHGINYIIDAGTLLGAVRHGGFIPWDDDIDIRMLRADYDRFCEICQTELRDDYFLQTYKTDPGYRWAYARILKKGTVYKRINHGELKSKTGIFIDIFPNDNLPESNFAYKRCTCISWLCRKMLYSELGKLHAKTFLNRFGFMFLDIFPKRCAYTLLEGLINKYRNIETSKVRCFGWGSQEETLGFQKEWLVNTCDIRFEDITVKAPIKTHEFLVHSFGEDYLTPPPEDKRVPGHAAEEIIF